MDLTDRFWFLILGCCIGFVLGYVVRLLQTIEKEVEEIKHKDDPDYIPEKKEEVKKLKRRSWKWPTWLTFNRIAVALVVYLTAVAAWQAQQAVNKFEEAQQASVEDRCEAGEALRDAVRSTVEAVYKLAIGAAERKENDPPLTAKEAVQYNDYISRVNTFREVQYANLQPTPECAPYVDDFGKKPPTPPYPLYELSK